MKNIYESIFLFKPDACTDWNLKKKAVYYIYRALLLTLAGICMGLMIMIFAFGEYPWGSLRGYLEHPIILVLNIVPVVFMIFLVYGISGRAWVAFAVGGFIPFGFSLANYYKLSFRDDPLYFGDIFIMREASAMTTERNYSLYVDWRIAGGVLCWLFGTALLALFMRGKNKSPKARISIIASVILASVCLWPTYMDTSLYNSIENFEILNRWSATQNYVSRGFIYPFIHSITELKTVEPDGYDREEAEEMINAYDDADIPEEKRVNIITVMREAYVDFSDYGIEGLDCSEYEGFHSLLEESYSGDLIVNIFAGGTIDSERCYLTGNYSLKDYRSNTNSYLWYLREQGFTVEGSHPYYKWFYNRQNVNGYLGFESYRFWEEDYEYLMKSHLTKGAYMPPDSILYEEVYNDYIANKETGKPYFSYVLNIESHGPYSTSENYNGKEYLTGNYSDECKNAMNNYMYTIMEGDREILKLIEKLRDDPDPVVVVQYSDHLPWMGDSNVFYNEMGVDLDPSTAEGFMRYKSTHYLIWANDAAKKVIGHDMVGEGPTVTPNFLMNVLFEQLGWEGPAFMQAMGDVMDEISAIPTSGYYVVNGEITATIPDDKKELYQKFIYMQYYWNTEFIY